MGLQKDEWISRGTYDYGELSEIYAIYYSVYNHYPSLLEIIIEEIEENELLSILNPYLNSQRISLCDLSEGSENKVDIYFIVNEILLMPFLWNDKKTLFIFYCSEHSYDTVEQIKSAIQAFTPSVRTEVKYNKFYMFYSDTLLGMEYFILNEYYFEYYPIELESMYNDDFIDFDNKIRSFIANKNQSGIVILHGLPGTGKTNYLRYLAGQVTNKFIYISPEHINHINLSKFILQINEHKDSVFIFEDSELLLEKKENQSYFEHLFNLSHGLLSGCFTYKFIFTFNTSIHKIDSRIFQNENSVLIYEFRKLNVHKTQNLCSELKKPVIPDEAMTLADIFNL